MTPAYIATLEDSLKELALAEAEAHASLTPDEVTEAMQARAHTVAVWHVLEERHPHSQPLRALAAIATARAALSYCIAQTRAEMERPVPNLSLGKMRHGCQGHGR